MKKYDVSVMPLKNCRNIFVALQKQGHNQNVPWFTIIYPSFHKSLVGKEGSLSRSASGRNEAWSGDLCQPPWYFL